MDAGIGTWTWGHTLSSLNLLRTDTFSGVPYANILIDEIFEGNLVALQSI